VDFVHVIECVYEAAKALQPESVACWQQYVNWATACWQGREAEVLKQLVQWQTRQPAIS